MSGNQVRGCCCGAQPHCAYDTVVIFRRETIFYPITGTACEDWSIHAAMNPGTLSIETLDGKRIWPEGSKQ